MKPKYFKILSDSNELHNAAEKLSEKYTQPLDRLIINAIAPTVYMYAQWVISQAEGYGIKRLYFLARDGYEVKIAADAIIRQKGSDIKTHYFYCSRHSLRMAAYGFFDSSAYDRLFAESYSLSAFILLRRAEFDENERKCIYKSIGMEMSHEHRILSRKEFSELCSDLKNSEVFLSLLKEKSDMAYENTVGYIKQEGMLGEEKIGIVDLGWTGSMQSTLCRLLRSCSCNSQIIGFYMGMLETPPDDENSRYDLWLFGSRDILIKSWFSQNLLECLLTAPHGMTGGYFRKNDRYYPDLFENENNADIISHISDIISEYAEKMDGFIYNNRCPKTALRLLRALMLLPDGEEAAAAEEFSFCDDISEEYHSRVASDISSKQLVSAVLHRHSTDRRPYWVYGAAAKKGRRIYGYAYYLSEVLRNIINQYIRKRRKRK